MGLFQKIFKLSKPINRRRLSGETVAALLRTALHGRVTANYRHIGQKTQLAVTAREKIVQASDRAFMPWLDGRWECENQAMAVVNEAQKIAANEGCSWACGMLRGRRTEGMEDALHVWVWALVEEDPKAMFPTAKLLLYDATAREWDDLVDVKDIDYTLT